MEFLLSAASSGMSEHWEKLLYVSNAQVTRCTGFSAMFWDSKRNCLKGRRHGYICKVRNETNFSCTFGNGSTWAFQDFATCFINGCTLQKLLLLFSSFLCTLHCSPLILKWIFTFWASWAEDYSIEGWQVGMLPGWHHSCPRLADHLATPKNIYCTFCYLCFMFHMLTFSPVSKFFCCNFLTLDGLLVMAKHKSPSCSWELSRKIISPDARASFSCLFLWRAAAPH